MEHATNLAHHRQDKMHELRHGVAPELRARQIGSCNVLDEQLRRLHSDDVIAKVRDLQCFAALGFERRYFAQDGSLGGAVQFVHFDVSALTKDLERRLIIDQVHVDEAHMIHLAVRARGNEPYFLAARDTLEGRQVMHVWLRGFVSATDRTGLSRKRCIQTDGLLAICVAVMHTDDPLDRYTSMDILTKDMYDERQDNHQHLHRMLRFPTENLAGTQPTQAHKKCYLAGTQPKIDLKPQVIDNFSCRCFLSERFPTYYKTQ